MWTRNFTKVITLKHQQKRVLEAQRVIRIMKTKGARVSLLSQRAINFHILSATPVNYFHKLCERCGAKFRLCALRFEIGLVTGNIDSCRGCKNARERMRGGFNADKNRIMSLAFYSLKLFYFDSSRLNMKN